jgi:CBS domain containing-hemolysin-like protein
LDAWFDLLPWLIPLVVLIAFSAFFSASEAALFYLTWKERKRLATGNRAQRAAATLLENPDRLLSAVLFWNLVINMTYFAIAAKVGLLLGDEVPNSSSTAFIFGILSLLAIIFCSEMLPKSVAVLSAYRLTNMISLPLSLAVRVVDPIMPVLRFTHLLSQRLLWPGFQPEPYLEVSDLERAVEISSDEAELVEQEQTVLSNIVQLSDIRVDEWMRPRTQFLSFRPPVSAADLQGQLPPSGYLLVTEPKSEEIASAINLKRLSGLPETHLEHLTKSVIHVPWCALVADVLQQLQTKNRDVAAVVNEFGETIGILTFEDILDTVFRNNPSRSGRLLNRASIEQVDVNCWHIIGMTSIRRIGRFFKIELPATKSVTLAGILQQSLQRLPLPGDRCQWGPFQLHVLEAPDRGHLLVEVKIQETMEASQ